MDKKLETILITGATGHLGSLVWNQLEGYNKIGLKRINSIVPTNLKSGVWFNFEDGLSELFKQNDIDIVVHCACAYGKNGESNSEIIEANLSFPCKLLDECIKNEVSFVLNVSTVLPKNRSAYSLSKHQFTEWLNFSEIKSATLLLEQFIGADEGNIQFSHVMAKKMLNGEQEVLLTSGEQRREFLDVNDVVDGVLYVLNSRNSLNDKFSVFHLGSGILVSIKQLIEFIKEETQSSTKLLFGEVKNLSSEHLENLEEYTRLQDIGWKPKSTWKIAVQKLIKSLRN